MPLPSVASPFRGVRHPTVSFRATGSAASATSGKARNCVYNNAGRAALLRSTVRIPLTTDATASRAGSARVVARSSPGGDAPGGAGAGRPGPADWYCPDCGFRNFASRESCRECECERPSSPSPPPSPARNTASASRGRGAGAPTADEWQPPEERAGDWNCPACSFRNFASNDCCDECDEPRPTGSGKVRRGRDWTCPECGFLNFGSRSSCHECLLERPKPKQTPKQLNRQQAQAAGGSRGQQSGSAGAAGAAETTPHGKSKRGRASKPGEWQCSTCGFTNFPQRDSCFKCGNPK